MIKLETEVTDPILIISFDLDDLLIPSTVTFQTESQTLIHRMIGAERIRKGTKELFKELRRNGHDIWIYTTSFRSSRRVIWTFRSYGIPVDRYIDQQRHDKTCVSLNIRCSKYPPAFGIDVHVDDAPGVGIEGERYGFATIIISPNDPNWAQTVMDRIQAL